MGSFDASSLREFFLGVMSGRIGTAPPLADVVVDEEPVCTGAGVSTINGQITIMD